MQYLSNSNLHRADRGNALVIHYNNATRSGLHETAATDLIADVLHYLNSNPWVREKIDAEAVLDRALRTYNGDFEDEPA